MATDEQRLSMEQRELVAVGASIGAGCHPCVKYHIKAGTDVGLAGGRLLAAVASAERVVVEAAERMHFHARAQLGPVVTPPAAMLPLDDALASFGAALAANDLTNIERHILAASELGASRPQLQEAIEVAQKVQQNAARIHGREAERLLETSTLPAPSVDDDGACADNCPCHADEDEAAVAGIDSETCATGANSEQSPFTPTSNRAARPARSTASVAEAAEEANEAGPFKEMRRCCAMHSS